MNEFIDPPSGATSTVFRDIIFLALAGFVAVVIILLPHINPPKVGELNEVPAPGNMMVEIFWDDDLDVDVDLWVKAPDDEIVGYSTKSGKIFDLLRDDLGFTNDTSNRNYELAITRGVIPGEYIINVMLYESDLSTIKQLPIKVMVIVSMKKKRDDKLGKILEKTVNLWIDKEEITVFSFRLDHGLNLVKGSVSSILIPLSIESEDRPE